MKKFITFWHNSSLVDKIIEIELLHITYKRLSDNKGNDFLIAEGSEDDINTLIDVFKMEKNINEIMY